MTSVRDNISGISRREKRRLTTASVAAQIETAVSAIPRPPAAVPAATAGLTAGVISHVASGDQATKAFAIQRSNHTGTQTASTISDFTAAVGISPRRNATATESLLLSDVGKTIYPDGAAGQILTIEPDSVVDWPEGAEIRIVNYLAHAVIARGAGVELYWLGGAGTGGNGNRTVGEFSWARLWQHSANTWFIEGNNLS